MVVPHPPFPAKLDRPAAAHDCVVFSIAAHVPLAYAPIRPLLHAWKESMARYILTTVPFALAAAELAQSPAANWKVKH